MSADPLPSPEMLEHFLRRTRKHIARVSRNLEKVGRHVDYRQLADLLRQRAAVHDASKFEEPERTPRIWAVEFTRCEAAAEPFGYPPDMEARFAAAEQHHLRVNSHHPEYHPHPDSMSVLDVIEMVCDWTAMAQARNACQGSARCWAEQCLGHVYPFGEEKRHLIFRIIGILET